MMAVTGLSPRASAAAVARPQKADSSTAGGAPVGANSRPDIALRQRSKPVRIGMDFARDGSWEDRKAKWAIVSQASADVRGPAERADASRSRRPRSVAPISRDSAGQERRHVTAATDVKSSTISGIRRDHSAVGAAAVEPRLWKQSARTD